MAEGIVGVCLLALMFAIRMFAIRFLPTRPVRTKPNTVDRYTALARNISPPTYAALAEWLGTKTTAYLEDVANTLDGFAYGLEKVGIDSRPQFFEFVAGTSAAPPPKVEAALRAMGVADLKDLAAVLREI